MASPLAIRSATRSEEAIEATETSSATERDLLLGSSSRAARSGRVKKSWYRPRPLWLVPFAVTASICRSMTLAPRTEVFTHLACEELGGSKHHHTTSAHYSAISPSFIYSNLSIPYTRHWGFSDIDGLAPFILDKAAVVRIPPGEKSPRIEMNKHKAEKSLPRVGNPPIECLTDPRVQAGASRLSTIFITTMGTLSALTTGWWGQFGDRHGRTKVIATAVSGLLFTDLMFIVASNPPDVLKGHAHTLLIVAPVIEGLTGGWSTLQGATHAYISDCTSPGSRAHVFSRFIGVFYIGVAVGPEIAALILRSTHMTTLVFYASAICAFVNLFLVAFVFPESLSAEQRARNIQAAQEAKDNALRDAEGKTGMWNSTKSGVLAFVKPLGVIGPQRRALGRGRDWTLPFASAALFCYFLTLALFQTKYLYAEHMFGWDAEWLSYYITAVGSARALNLLVILPMAIRILKPTSPTPTRKDKRSKDKATPTPSALLSEIKFDLFLAKVSLILDIFSHTLVTLAPDSSQSLFVGSTMLSAFGAGAVPTLQSVAMCVLHLRENEAEEGAPGAGADIGKLFGAFAVLQAVGNMILGPMLFGTVYSLTVAAFAKTIFILAAGLLVVSVTLLTLIRVPRVNVPIQIRVDTRVEVDVERIRGRSRRSKDIRPALC